VNRRLDIRLYCVNAMGGGARWAPLSFEPHVTLGMRYPDLGHDSIVVVCRLHWCGMLSESASRLRHRANKSGVYFNC
jgi:hypothetical protein